MTASSLTHRIRAWLSEALSVLHEAVLIVVFMPPQLLSLEVRRQRWRRFARKNLLNRFVLDDHGVLHRWARATHTDRFGRHHLAGEERLLWSIDVSEASFVDGAFGTEIWDGDPKRLQAAIDSRDLARSPEAHQKVLQLIAASRTRKG